MQATTPTMHARCVCCVQTRTVSYILFYMQYNNTTYYGYGTARTPLSTVHVTASKIPAYLRIYCTVIYLDLEFRARTRTGVPRAQCYRDY
jgi:hypothetical protein